jgi:hypothetical protein
MPFHPKHEATQPALPAYSGAVLLRTSAGRLAFRQHERLATSFETVAWPSHARTGPSTTGCIGIAWWRTQQGVRVRLSMYPGAADGLSCCGDGNWRSALHTSAPRIGTAVTGADQKCSDEGSCGSAVLG